MREFPKSDLVSIAHQPSESASFSPALSAWIPVTWQHRFGNVLPQIHPRKQIIRTRLPQGRSGSDYIGLVPVTGLEPVRHRWRWILSPLRLPFHHTGRKEAGKLPDSFYRITYPAEKSKRNVLHQIERKVLTDRRFRGIIETVT